VCAGNVLTKHLKPFIGGIFGVAIRVQLPSPKKCTAFNIKVYRICGKKGLFWGILRDFVF
jgi:hypothetical protein